jgi:putative PIN family toxin of toxin-antitoxin system
MHGLVVPLVSRATSEELIRVLAYPKFRLQPKDIEAVLGAYLPYAEIIEVESMGALHVPVCRDENDQMFVLLAAVGQAEVLVSGDKALLDLAGQTHYKIETAAEFQKRFAN